MIARVLIPSAIRLLSLTMVLLSPPRLLKVHP
jgi:hypothetical protein